MKHTKKKFLMSTSIGTDVVDVLNSATVNENAIVEFRKKNFEGMFALIQTEGNELIQAFKYTTNNRTFFIPEPNPIVIYFEIGRFYYRKIEEAKSNLFSELDKSQVNVYETLNKFYTFYTHSSACAIFLFNSIESFINKSIPKEYKYSKTIDRRTEIYDKEQIQRHVSFEEKFRCILPEIKQKSFQQKFSHKYDSILKLKEFRDEIMHTKAIDETF